MNTSLRRTLSLIALATLAYGGFHWGRAFGSQSSRPRFAGISDLSRMLSANALGAMGDGEHRGQPDSKVPPLTIFEDVLDKVQREYVESTRDTARLSNGALAKLFAALDDPGTYYLEPKLRKARQDALRGHFQGIGAELTVIKSRKGDVDYQHLTVMTVLPGSPAEKAGLHTGDRLMEIDGRWIVAYSRAAEVAKLDLDKMDYTQRQEAGQRIENKFKQGLNVPKALTLLTQGEGRALTLTVQRPGVANPFPVQLTTAVTNVEPVEYRVLSNQVGYLRVGLFNQKAVEKIEATLTDLAPDLKGLIIDLRRNPGGVVSDTVQEVDGMAAARTLLSRLTSGGKVGLIEYKPNQKTPLTVTGRSERLNVPIVALVDRGTAGLSELVAAALRDAGKAKIVGTRTFGDGMLQLFAVFKNGSGVEMTTAHLFTASGADIARGVTPDITVKEDMGQDTALQRALALLGV